MSDSGEIANSRSKPPLPNQPALLRKTGFFDSSSRGRFVPAWEAGSAAGATYTVQFGAHTARRRFPVSNVNSMEAVTAFFGWTTVINFALLVVATIMVVVMRGSISRMHGRMFGLETADLSRAYFQSIAQYKIAIIVFSLTPYVALKLVSSFSQWYSTDWRWICLSKLNSPTQE